ncbi:MAG: hypothetical protein K6G64_06670 [Eubacterium sp.]|nr:hypothetical protein [Eubacterium sp.]
MKTYSYKQITSINKRGINFVDGSTFLFEECKKNWAASRNMNLEDNICVAERDASAKIPYFLFYADEKVKIQYKKSFFSWNDKSKRKFASMQIKLNRLGYSSFDLS